MKISELSFTIVANGFADGPAQPLRDYLLDHKAKKLIMINHPLVGEGSSKHLLTIYEDGKQTSQKKYNLPNKPPYTFALDPIAPLKVPESDIWFAFNNLATLKGLKQKKRGKTKKVYYWAVDFVPNRFGNNAMTKAYNWADKKVCRQADGRIELTATALEKRPQYLKLREEELCKSIVVPMGAWLGRTPKAELGDWSKKKVVYLGHLVERQGVKTLIAALGILAEKNVDFSADIIGGGPLEGELKTLSETLHLSDRIKFHGFVKDHKNVENILGGASVAVAPYVKDSETFTQFADPGKLKAYMGAGLPMVLTDVPPNAKELHEAGVAVLVKDSPVGVAKGIETLLSKSEWQKSHKAVMKYAKQYDWGNIFDTAFKELDLT